MYKYFFEKVYRKIQKNSLRTINKNIGLVTFLQKVFFALLIIVIISNNVFSQNRPFSDSLIIVVKADFAEDLRSRPTSEKYNHISFDGKKYSCYVNYRSGVRDEAGNWIIPEENQFIIKKGDVFEVHKKGWREIIDRNGTLISREPEKLYIARKNKRLGVIDIHGNAVIPCLYDVIHVDNDFYRVSKDKKWGVIDSVGKTIIPLEYDHLSAFKNGVSKVKKNDLIGFIDINNRVVVDIKYAYINPSNNGVADACECEQFVQANSQKMVEKYEKMGYVLLRTPTRLMAMCKNPTYSQLEIE